MKAKAQLTNLEDVKEYVLAGNSTVTLVSKRTGTRLTFTVRKPDVRSPWFINVLNGPDNTSWGKFVGYTKLNLGRYTFNDSAKGVSTTAPSFITWSWFNQYIINEQSSHALSQVEVWTSGKCGRCGRKLTVPSSVATGIGPVCLAKVQ